MATKKLDATVADITDDTSFDVAELEQQALATRGTFGDIQGADDQRIDLPVLKLAYGVGGLSKAGFNDGDWVVDEDNQVGTRKEPLFVTVLEAVKYWKEYLPWDPNSDNRHRIFASEQEANNAGLTTRWQGGEGPQCSEAARFALLIHKPENYDSGLFADLLGNGKEFLACEYYVDKAAYRGTFPPVFAASRLSLKGKFLQQGIFELGSKKETAATGNIRTTPYMRKVGELTAEEAVAIRELFGIG